MSPQVSSTPNNKTSDPSTPAAKARVSSYHLHPQTSHTSTLSHLLSAFTTYTTHSTSTQDTPHPCCLYLLTRHEEISKYQSTLQFALHFIVTIITKQPFSLGSLWEWATANQEDRNTFLINFHTYEWAPSWSLVFSPYNTFMDKARKHKYVFFLACDKNTKMLICCMLG